MTRCREKLARILTGGDLNRPRASPNISFRLEREAFLSLCGERKTQERIAHSEERQAAEELDSRQSQ